MECAKCEEDYQIPENSFFWTFNDFYDGLICSDCEDTLQEFEKDK